MSMCTLSYEPGTEQPGMCKGLAKSSHDLPGDLALAENDDDDHDDENLHTTSVEPPTNWLKMDFW